MVHTDVHTEDPYPPLPFPFLPSPSAIATYALISSLRHCGLHLPSAIRCLCNLSASSITSSNISASPLAASTALTSSKPTGGWAPNAAARVQRDAKSAVDLPSEPSRAVRYSYYLPRIYIPRIAYHQPPATRATYHLPPTTYHLPPTTYHLPPTAYHLPPTTHHLPPTTYHLPPTAQYLTTGYCPLTRSRIAWPLAPSTPCGIGYYHS